MMRTAVVRMGRILGCIVAAALAVGAPARLAAAQSSGPDGAALTPEARQAMARSLAAIGPAVSNAVRDALAGIRPVLRTGAGETAGAEQRQDREFRIERTDRQTRTLSLGPTGSLELKNISGDIHVTAGPGRDAVLEIVRHSRGRSESDAALGLQEVQVTVDQQGERATVETVYPNNRGRRPYQMSATYTVTAPAGTRITASSVSGDVTVANIKGDVSAQVVSGNVELHGANRVAQARSVSGNVTLSDITSDSGITANSVSGSVQLSRVTARRISAEVVSGNVRADDVTCDSANLKTLSGNVDFSGRLARGGRYEFTSHSGDVHLAIGSGSGFELQAATFSGSVRPDPSLRLEAISTGRGSLRARLGDGSALLVVNTFSGNVILTR